ncbi:hypothetical protein [Campylobacter corcagiensis]|uniref:Uncharacterized protein n=1 Tax=Campylobacter corcagiensis TaxID=1448857 RepID=A0A7M1LFF8_9BACT|nr:hypothetical protein [Campylobacter corcagiensis]QKF65055.1 putative membrane protein [Campylobacter corcagiensis]QOQ86794.1 hypothetical protein IMC76_06130 [Campylobacter corcagiensis]
MNSFKEKVVYGMFTVSKKPVLFRDLLEANSTYNENMLVDPSKLNFKFKYGKSYIIFGLLCLAILIPLIILTHKFLAKADVHISLIVAILVTASIFIGFDIFKAWARSELTKDLIKKAWRVHFPYFDYDKYNQKVEEIYNEAVKKEIPKRDLEKYVIDTLVKLS